ncbi:MAG: amidophosphoribosyltransferase, partial [Bacteroidota bacterium]
FRVSCPPVTHPCFYGMDFPNKEELLANQFDSVEEIGEWLGVDSLAYLSVEGMKRAVYGANSNNTQGYCAACFTGNYPVPVNMDASKEENEMWAPATAEAA